MSVHAIKQYLSEVERTKDFGGSSKETSIRRAFANLLNEYARPKDLMLIDELNFKTEKGKTKRPDGTLKDRLQGDWGFWESKDSDDSLDDDIAKKFAIGYPKDNILFEDSQTAVLIQQGSEVLRVKTNDLAALDNLLKTFVNYERPEIRAFRDAIELFKINVPKVTDALREIIFEQDKSNPKFCKNTQRLLGNLQGIYQPRNYQR